jgi:hypothetical protein
LRKWDRIANWVRDNRAFLRIRSRVEQALKRWSDAGNRPDLLLPEGLDLEEASALLKDAPLLLAGSEYAPVRNYITASQDFHETRRRRIEATRRTVTFFLVLLTLGASGAAVYGFWQSKKAVEEGAKAISQRDAAYLQEGKAWLLRASVAEERQKRYPDTLLYAAQAIGFEGVGRKDDAEEPRRFIRPKDKEYQEAQDWIASHPAYLPVWSSSAGEPITAMAVDPAGKQLALGSTKGVRLIEVVAAKETALPGLTGITDLKFASVGQSLAIAATEGVHLLKGETTSVVSKTPFTSLSWSPAGDLLAASAPDGTIHLFRRLDLWSDPQKSRTVGSQIQATKRIETQSRNPCGTYPHPKVSAAPAQPIDVI